MNAITKVEGGALAHPAQQAFSLAPRNLDEAFRLADMLAQSDMVPKDFRGKPGNVMIAMQWGFEVGLKPLQSLQNIAVINGRPSMWGDAVLALVRASPLCEYVLEHEEPDGTAVCRAKRRGEPEQIRTFSNQDAKVAGLHGKAGPWVTSPKRMKQMRARSFALRDVFTDVLKGMDIAEVVMDYTDLTPSKPIQSAASPAVEAPAALLASAREAARAGRDKFAAWWKAATPADRGLLAGEIDALKILTEEADAARTVDDTPATDPAPVDPFIAAIERQEQEGEQS